MCRIEERVYVAPDGSRQMVEEPFYCSKALGGKYCSEVTRRKTTYHTGSPHDASSPASLNPPTPTGSYLVRTAEPSRPTSSSHGGRKIKPSIVIQVGASKSKDKKSYHSSKRSSLGATSVASSNEAHLDSPRSSTSPFHTGYPEASSQGYPSGYTTVPAVPANHRRNHSSTSSVTSASHPPPLYTTTEPDSPSRRYRNKQPTVIHNPPADASALSASPRTTRAHGSSSPAYRIIRPNDSSSSEHLADNKLFPLGYEDYHRDPSNSSHGSTSRAAAPEVIDREEDTLRREQEELDRQYAHTVAEEDMRQAAIESGRGDARAKARAEQRWAEYEMDRANSREVERLEKQKERAREEKLARESKESERKAKSSKDSKSKKDKTHKKDRDRMAEETSRRRRQEESRSSGRDNRPPTADRSRRYSRRGSVSHADRDMLAEVQRPVVHSSVSQAARDMSLAETQRQMAREREAADERDRKEQWEASQQQSLLRRQAEERERQERARKLKQDQKRPEYYSLRGPGGHPDIGRSSRRNSLSGDQTLSRSNSRRVSVHQDLPPASTNYSMRPPSAHGRPDPQSFFPASSTHSTSSRSYHRGPPPTTHHRVFDQQPTYASPPGHSAPATEYDEWATDDPTPAPRPTSIHHRQPSDSRPHQRQPSDPHVHRTDSSDDRPTLRRRGEQIIARDEAEHRAREAASKLHKVVTFEANDYEDSEEDESEEENEEDQIAGLGPRLGLGKDGGRKGNIGRRRT